MKKIVYLILSVLVLVGCSKDHDSLSKVRPDNKSGESTLKFVVAPQYKGQTSELIELGKKLTTEHPDLGEKDKVSLYYVGATYRLNETEYAVFMFINRTERDLNRDAEFKVNWSYDGQFIYQEQIVDYKISDNGQLPSQSATILLLPVNSTQKEIVDKIAEEAKMILEISDVQMKG